MIEYENHILRRMTEHGVNVDVINKVKSKEDKNFKEACIKFIINADMNPQMEIDNADIEGFIETLEFALNQNKDWDKKSLVDRLADKYSIKKNYNMTDEELMKIINASKDLNELDEIIGYKFFTKKEEKVYDCIEKGYSEDEVDFLKKFTPRFIDKIINLNEAGISFDLIEQTYYENQESGDCPIIKFNENLNGFGSSNKTK